MSTPLVNELKALNDDPEFFEEVARLAANTNAAVFKECKKTMNYDSINIVTAGLVSGIVGALINKNGG